jgi:hypothetical protein
VTGCLICLDWPLQSASVIATSGILFSIFFSISPLNNEMNDDAEIQSRLTNGGPSFFAMDEAFCARVLAAIEAGLESAPIGVVTTPGTKNPKYVPTEPRPLTSSQRDLEHA